MRWTLAARRWLQSRWASRMLLTSQVPPSASGITWSKVALNRSLQLKRKTMGVPHSQQKPLCRRNIRCLFGLRAVKAFAFPGPADTCGR